MADFSRPMQSTTTFAAQASPNSNGLAGDDNEPIDLEQPPELLLKQWQPRSQPRSQPPRRESLEPSTAARPGEETAAESVGIDRSISTLVKDASISGTRENPTLIDDTDTEEPKNEAAWKSHITKFRLKGANPPASVAPGEWKPYYLPPNACECPFATCKAYNVKKSRKKLRKHMRKVHNWPRAWDGDGEIISNVKNVRASPKKLKGVIAQSSAPQIGVKESTPKAPSIPPKETQDPAVDTVVSEGVRKSPPVNKPVADGLESRETPDVPSQQRSQVPSSIPSANLFRSSSTHSSDQNAPAQQALDVEDLSYVPVIPGQTEPFFLPEGIMSCPLTKCHWHDIHQPVRSKVTEHMKRSHGWPRPIDQERLERAAKAAATKQQPKIKEENVTPLMSNGKGKGADITFTDALQESRKRTVNGQLKEILPVANDSLFYGTPSLSQSRTALMQVDESLAMANGSLCNGTPKTSQSTTTPKQMRENLPVTSGSLCNETSQISQSESMPDLPTKAFPGASASLSNNTTQLSQSSTTPNRRNESLFVASESLSNGIPQPSGNSTTTKQLIVPAKVEQELHMTLPIQTLSIIEEVNKTALREGTTWVEAEEKLVVHVKEELKKDDRNLTWREIGAFFRYRGTWHPAQSRYSILSRTRKGILPSKGQKRDVSPRTSAQVSPSTSAAERAMGYPEFAFTAIEYGSPSRSSHTVGRPRRSDRTRAEPGTFAKFFRKRPLEDASEDEGHVEEAPTHLLDGMSDATVEEPDLKVESHTLDTLYQAQHADDPSREIVPVRSRNVVPKLRLQIERERNVAVVNSLTPRITRQPVIHLPKRGPRQQLLTRGNFQKSLMKRRSIQLQKPYLTRQEREVLAELSSTSGWDAGTGAMWTNQALHIDFTEREVKLLLQVIAPDEDLITLPVHAQLRNLLLSVSEEDIGRIAFRAVSNNQRRFLNRTLASIKSFLWDLKQEEPPVDSRIEIFDYRQIQPQPKSASLLRQRELGAPQHDLSIFRTQMSSRFGPQYRFQSMSSDVNTVAWAPNGRNFAIGSAALTDVNSMQYNKPNNLLFGDLETGHLTELAHHVIKREATHGVNATRAMQASQDTLLFTTISDVQFSSDNHVMITAGYDKHVRIWALDEGETGIGTICRWSLQRSAEVDLLAMATCVGDSPRLFAAAAKTQLTAKGNKAVKLYSYSPDLETCEIKGTLSSSRAQYEMGASRIDPSCLRWSTNAQNRYVLGGFSASEDTEKRGEACLWDVETGQELGVSLNKRSVFDIQWSPSVWGRFAIGGGVVAKKVNRGTLSAIRIHDSRWLPERGSMFTSGQSTFELECPASDMNDVLFNPRDTNLISAGCTDGSAYIWDLRSPHKLLHHLTHGNPLFELDSFRRREEFDTGVRFLSWDLHGRQLFSGSSDGVVATWDPYLSQHNAFQREVVRMSSGVMAGSFSPDHSNLLLGDAEGSVLMLSIGREDEEAEAFHFQPDESTKEERREKFASENQEKPSEEPDSGKAIAERLVQSKEIEIKPYGNFPKKQAVKGPHYVGPFDLAIDSNELRKKAALSQSQAARQEAQSNDVAIVEDDITDEKHWEKRLPYLMHEPPYRQHARLIDPCSRCSATGTEQSIEDSSLLALAGDSDPDSVICLGCNASWRADVLGWQLLDSGTAAKRKSSQNDSDVTISDDEADAAAGTVLEPVETAPRYLDLWDVDEVAIRRLD